MMHEIEEGSADVVLVVLSVKLVEVEKITKMDFCH